MGTQSSLKVRGLLTTALNFKVPGGCVWGRGGGYALSSPNSVILGVTSRGVHASWPQCLSGILGVFIFYWYVTHYHNLAA